MHNVHERLHGYRRLLAELQRSEALSSGDIDAAYRHITELAVQLLEVERASVWRLGALGTELHCSDLYERSKHQHSQGQVIFAKDVPAYFAALAEERCLAVGNAHEDPRTIGFLDSYLRPLGIGAMLDAPIWVSGRMVGVVCHEHVGDPRHFELYEELLAGTVGDFVARVIEASDRLRAERALGQYRRHIHELISLRGLQRDQLRAALERESAEWRISSEPRSERETPALSYDASPVPISIARLADGEIVYANRRAIEMFGTEKVVGKQSTDFYVDPADRAAFVSDLRREGRVEGFVAELKTHAQRPFWALINAVRLSYRGEDCVMAAFADVTAQKVAEIAVRKGEQSLRTLFAATPVPLILSRVSDQTVVLANQRAADLFEVPLSQVVGEKTPDYYVDAEQRDRIVHHLLRDGLAEEPAVRLRTRPGRLFWGHLSARAIDFEGEPCFLVGVHDVTPQKELEDQLRELATHDALTGLRNRRYFMEVAAREIERVARSKTPLSLCMLDADHFKQINDEHGHAVGDRVLAALAGAATSVLRSVDVLARVGGEEFEALLPDTDLAGAISAAERMQSAVREVVVTTDAGVEVRPRVSIGVTTLRPGDDLEALLRRADDALYEAKQTGRNRTVVH